VSAPETLQRSLADRYAIERELGRGGMATVYLARDLRHDRPVALKVLHPELAASLGPERFLREIRFAARLQHPHILTVLDSGEIPQLGAAPLLWFAMPFVRGESLRDRLRRETQLPVADALRITKEAADALAFAHTEGVIHRDIKPENILLSGAHALVADFGIARALGASDDKLTETGFAVGTPAYMSPEQASGQRELDARTDIYSLAVVLYEMLAGETPFAAPTAQAMLARRFTEAARPIRQLREAVPESVELALQRALARTPADRFATTAEFAAALEAGSPATAATAAPAATAPSFPPPPSPSRRRFPPAAAALVLGLLIGLGVLFAWRRGHDEAATGTRFLAVLPFENVGAASEEYFADGITDAVRGKLSAVPGIEVIAGRSSAEYKKSDKSLAQIARELGVTHLVVAKVRWAKAADGSSRVQVSPELVQVAPGGTPTTKWQQSFDAALTDVFQVQADVAERVAEELGVALADSARRELAARPTRNLDAYDLYLRAEGAALAPGRSDPNSIRRAIALYEQAIALDSSFVLAWARLSTATSLLYANTAPSRELAVKAREAADRALALGPSQAASHVAIASYYRGIQRDNERALQSLLRAKQLAPGDAQTINILAQVERDLGRDDAALEHLRQAERLDPRSAAIAGALGRVLLGLRRFDAADSALRRAQSFDPGNAGLVQQRARAALGRADLAGARAIVAGVPAEMDQRDLAVYFATYNEMYWVLDSAQQALVVRAGPDDFDGDVGSWGLALAQIYAAWSDRPRMRAYADSARAGFAEQMEAAPDDPQPLILHALSIAYLGRTDEAVREGERAVAMFPMSRSANLGSYLRELLARLYVMAGEPEKAVDRLEEALAVPSLLSPGVLRFDPHFAPLRRHPRFIRLVEGKP
jgi:TolB-like protein/Flp pilus assembly protein TadD